MSSDISKTLEKQRQDRSLFVIQKLGRLLFNEGRIAESSANMMVRRSWKSERPRDVQRVLRTKEGHTVGD